MRVVVNRGQDNRKCVAEMETLHKKHRGRSDRDIR